MYLSFFSPSRCLTGMNRLQLKSIGFTAGFGWIFLHRRHAIALFSCFHLTILSDKWQSSMFVFWSTFHFATKFRFVNWNCQFSTHRVVSTSFKIQNFHLTKSIDVPFQMPHNYLDNIVMPPLEHFHYMRSALPNLFMARTAHSSNSIGHLRAFEVDVE